MPHAVHADDLQQQQDDAEIARLLNNDPSGQPDGALDFLNRDLEVGDKADDAEDFEDIGDDDLASEEEEETGNTAARSRTSPILTRQHDAHSTLHDFDFGDDLFGDEDGPAKENAEDHTESINNVGVKPSSISLPGFSFPADGDDIVVGSPTSHTGPTFDATVKDEPHSSATPEPMVVDGEEVEDEEEDDEVDEAVALQRALFARAGHHATHDSSDALETNMELFFSIWPSYDPEKTAKFTELFPPVPGVFKWKTPIKPPKTLNLGKLSLDIAPDTEKSFRQSNIKASGKMTLRSDFEKLNVISTAERAKEDQSSDEDLDNFEVHHDEPVGGLDWQDIELACCDWDAVSLGSSGSSKRDHDDFMSDLPMQSHPTKRVKIGNPDFSHFTGMPSLIPAFDDPELSTRRLAKRVVIDAHDTDMLIDESQQRKQTVRQHLNENKEAAGRDIGKRYNISNDAAYELLKENHQHKIRSTLGGIAIEHSMPAAKLQYPFYRVKLELKQMRSFHRPSLGSIRIGREMRFSRPKNVKRKHLRGRETKDIFAKAEDLSMGDNSSGLLLEYSEEMPMMLSNFGMGNRFVNFYRRKDDQDTSRPKEEIGETQVLLPQDRSPFANFGHVDPGETVPAIQNGMCRAPIFKHDSRQSDFLVVCSTSNENSTRIYLRNLENLHTVGQQFPSTDIPGEHSRKVTDAAKRRLRAISYRIWRKWTQRRGGPLTNQVVQAHLPGSDIAQNRGKLREFMKYDKNNSWWLPKDGEMPPDTAELRSMIKPEDVCLLDSMQVGVQHLTALGLRRDEDVNDDDDDKEGTNVELLLAPWSTTKNFLNACQGKAMLQLHGEGDPTGRGEGFSFIKTSMKGGFRALGESIEERLDAKKLKENHGHSYNVAKQQKAYDESIRRIWRSQQESLSSRAELSDAEGDIDDEADDFADRATTPRHSFGTPSFSRREDESVSQLSRGSRNQGNQTLIITRTQRDRFGNLEEVPVTITNPRIISAYKRAKLKEQAEKIDPNMIQMTGDAEFDALQLKAAEEELDRLHKARERRFARQRAKGILPSPPPGTPGGADDETTGPSTPAGGAGPGSGKRGGRKKQATEGTGRRCANCGQIGHIKTNKKLCPMLNGTMKPEDINMGFGGGASGTGASASGSGPASGSGGDVASAGTTGFSSAFHFGDSDTGAAGNDDDEGGPAGSFVENLPRMEI